MTNENNESQKFKPIEYREDLLASFRIQENLLEGAIESLINSLKKKIAELDAEFEEALRVMPPEDDFDEDGNRTWRFRTLTGLHNEQSWENTQLLALNEIRVIYLYKNMELTLKSLIKTAYPSTNIRDFYRWDSIINFFNLKSINISKIDGYNEANELRILNNSLKHSLSLDGEVRRIPDFKDAEFLDNSLIESFLSRTVTRIELFQTRLIEEVRKDLYDFDEKRLKTMAVCYSNRLRKDQADVFIVELREQYESKKRTSE